MFRKYNHRSNYGDNHSVRDVSFTHVQVFPRDPINRNPDSYYEPLSNQSVRLVIKEEKIAEIQKTLSDMKPVQNLSYDELADTPFKAGFLEKRMYDIDQKVDYFMEKIERKPEIDYELVMIQNAKLEDPQYCDMLAKREMLPVYEKRNEILRTIERNQVTLLSGDTGCGKTTQVPQFLIDAFISESKGSLCKIVCTQPRRISAIGVADRVAKERAEEVGMSCGYQVRLEKVLPRKYASILYVTTGIVVRQMENDPLLNSVSHLILDEIHERDIHCDFLLGLVKRLITKRKDVKVILMSATLNEGVFRTFFDYCPHIQINGSTFPVDEYHLEDVVRRLNFKFTSKMQIERDAKNLKIFGERVIPYVKMLQRMGRLDYSTCLQLQSPNSEDLNLDLIFRLAMDIHAKEEEGAILIFVTGFDDIKKLYDMFERALTEDECILIGLHSQIPIEEQRWVFDETPPGVRKIIISTNIAETSITIEDVVYVIDSGWTKVKIYDAQTRTENLESRFISKANAIQRKGRAGRLTFGKCFRLYTKARFESFYDFAKPEILRVRLEDIIMQMKVLQLGKVREFFARLLDQPKGFIVDRSLELLINLGALDENEDLTPLGYYLAKLPLSPQLGKMLLLGVIFRCLDPIMNVVVGLDHKSPFKLDMRGNQNNQLIQFSEGIESDHLMLHKAMYLFQLTEKSKRQSLCAHYNFNYDVLVMMKKLKKDFMENLFALQLVNDKKLGNVEANTSSKNFGLIKSLICAALYPNIITPCTTLPGRGFRTFQTLNGAKVNLHKKSILFSAPLFHCPFLAYFVKLKTSLDMVHDATVCSPFSLVFFGSQFRALSSTICVNDFGFACERKTVEVLRELRDRLEQYIVGVLTNPTEFLSNRKVDDEKFLKSVSEILSSSHR